MGMAQFVSVPDAAALLDLSSARVRMLVANGGLPAEKIGGRWLVERSGIEYRRGRRSAGGRRFEPANAWAVLAVASGDDLVGVDSGARSRARRALSLEGLESLAPRLERRAEVRRYSGHLGEVARIAADHRLVASGVSAARAVGLDLVPGSEADGYISDSAVDGFVREHALAPAYRSAANVALRVVPDRAWAQFLDGREHAPEAAVALDLADEADPRSQAAGEKLLTRLDQRR
jgi:excisionase family DNA binding protein